EKGEEWIGGNRGMKLGAEDLLAVIFADEIGDDVARNDLAHVVDAKPGLHLVLDQGLDLDDLPALGLGRNVDEGACHHSVSRQAGKVTITCTLSLQNEPSLSSAMAVTVWLSASRMRVLKVARPARGPNFTPTTLDCGFFSLKRWMALT